MLASVGPVAGPRLPSARRVSGGRRVSTSVVATTPTTLRRAGGAGVVRKAADTSYENGTIDLELSTEEARSTLQFDKIVVNEQEGPVIFVTGRVITSH